MAGDLQKSRADCSPVHAVAAGAVSLFQYQASLHERGVKGNWLHCSVHSGGFGPAVGRWRAADSPCGQGRARRQQYEDEDQARFHGCFVRAPRIVMM
jgi:hypothetical protein